MMNQQGNNIYNNTQDQLVLEKISDFRSDSGKGKIREIEFDSIHIMRVDLKVSDTLVIPISDEDRTVVLFFCLKGESELNLGDSIHLKLKPSTHNIIYMNQSVGSIICENGDYEVFYIGMTPEMFREYFPRGEERFEKFNRQMNQTDFSLLRDEPGIINHRILKIIEDITSSDTHNSVKEIYLKAKVIELLSLQLGELCTICNPLPIVKPEDAEKMYKVKEFILSHLNENYSLKELAQIAETNEYTLKKEFKELFGTTVFGFWSDIKMEKAQKLLTETNSQVKKISGIIGYKNPQHFTTAFKKKFGLTPSQFRKNHE